MDDLQFVASYVAQETQRINERLRAMLERGDAVDASERDAVLEDIERTMTRLNSAVSQLDLSGNAPIGEPS